MYLAEKSTKAFLYRWIQKSTGMWYEGSRTAKGCHPEDGYICSAPRVESMITENRDDWTREVLVIGESKYIRKLEELRLTSLDAKNDPMSFNKDNANGKFSTTGMAAWNKGLSKECDPRLAEISKNTTGKASPLKGRKLGTYSEERVRAAAAALKGNEPWNKGLEIGPLSEEHKLKIHNTTKGIPKSEEHKQKQRKPKRAGHGAAVSAARKGKIFLPRLCRIEDKVETDVANYSRWLKKKDYAPNTCSA